MEHGIQAALLAAAAMVLAVGSFPSTVAQAAATCASWTLKSDFAAHPNQNPLQDACGQTGVWQFMQYSKTTNSFTLLMKHSAMPFGASVPGVTDMWSGDRGGAYGFTTPFVAINTSNAVQHFVTNTMQPGEVVVHPAADARAVIAWKSPITGMVKIDGGVTSDDANGGDGIAWFINQNQGSSDLAFGDYPVGGHEAFSAGTGASNLSSLPVTLGDVLYFMVDPKSNFYYDSTQVDVQITQIATAAAPPTPQPPTPTPPALPIPNAQPTAPRVVQATDGSLYVVQSGRAWTLVPDEITENDLSALNVIGELDGTLVAHSASVQIAQGTDGTLYVLQDGNAWTLVPDQIGDSTLGALDVLGEIDGVIPLNVDKIVSP
jgi:hypothetical protein